MALAPKHNVQTSVAEPPTLLDQGLQTIPQAAIVRSHRLIAYARPLHAEHPAGSPFAHLVGQLQVRRRLSMRRGQARHGLPTLDDRVDVDRVDLDAAASSARALGSNQGRP